MTRSALRGLLILGMLAGVAQGAPLTEARPTAPAEARPEVRYQPVTKYDYDNEEVTGDLVNPMDQMVTGRLRPGQASLLRPRLTFVPEMLKSAESL